MKLLRRKIKENSASRPDRLVVNFGRREKGKLPLKRNSFFRKLGRWTKGLKVILILMFFLMVTYGMVWLLFKLTDRNSQIVSPMPVNASTTTDDIEKKFIIELRKLNIIFTDVRQGDGSTYIIKLADKTEVFVTAAKDIPSQIASLQFIYNRLTMEGRLIRRLDLRYEKPVITFQ